MPEPKKTYTINAEVDANTFDAFMEYVETWHDASNNKTAGQLAGGIINSAMLLFLAGQLSGVNKCRERV